MTTRSIPTIDPAGVARRRGSDGEGIVIAVIATGIDARHPHFARNANLVLPPPLHHYDLTLLQNADKDTWASFADGDFSVDAAIASLSKLDRDLHDREALIDRNGLGTHVAAIVGGYVEAKDVEGNDLFGEPSMSGVAANCKLLSLKVIDDNGSGTDREVERALQLVIALNTIAHTIAVHGVLIPLAFRQDVQNFACGGTPVCRLVDRLVESGVVVIAPTGNDGYIRVNAPDGERFLAGLMTIGDPGNAERAITVGATHRFLPKIYGPSYFSGRGPTLDGRNKPDLLAPGERILSAVPAPIVRRIPSSRKGGKPARRKQASSTKPIAQYGVRDGTSAAAAHVAGAVAVVLSARRELVGQPEQVKQLLLSTATDLGRDPRFQGRGLLNLSRALGDEKEMASEHFNDEKPPQTTPQAAAQISRPDVPQMAPRPANPSDKRFSVAVSFPGTQRDYIKQVVFALREELDRSDIFYDKFYQAELSRPDLDIYLLDIYGKQSELVVVFLSADYEKADWCGLEWRAVRELIKTRAGHAVMPVRLDDTQIPGLLSIDGYVTAKNRDPEYVADLIIERLEANRKQ